MSKNSELAALRVQLDETITYGLKKDAMKLAREALEKVKAQSLFGEIEYFNGQIDILKGDSSAAIKHFDAAIKYNPYDGASYNDRALCMVESGVIDDALKYFDKGIEVEPDFATIHHNKGWLLNNIGRYAEAVQCLKAALKLEPNRAVTYDNLASVFFNLLDYKSAKEAYEKTLSLLGKKQCLSIQRQIKEKIKEIDKLIGRH